MDRKVKIRLLGKLLDAGFDTEKAVVEFGLKDLAKAGVKNDEIKLLLEFQEAVKKNKVVSFFSDEKFMTEKGGER